MAIATHVKKYDIFSRVLLGFSQGWKSLYNTAVYVIKVTFQLVTLEIPNVLRKGALLIFKNVLGCGRLLSLNFIYEGTFLKFETYTVLSIS